MKTSYLFPEFFCLDLLAKSKLRTPCGENDLINLSNFILQYPKILPESVKKVISITFQTFRCSTSESL